MLTVRTTRPPAGPDWCHEVKWDGVRVLLHLDGPRVRLESRNGNDITRAFPEFDALGVRRAGAAVDALVLDGEIVAMVDGRPSFAAVASRLTSGRAGRGEWAAAGARTVGVLLIGFDLLEVSGESLVDRPLRARRQALESLEFSTPAVQVPPVHEDGLALALATREQGLEGIVSKRWSSPYRPGRRSADWLKLPHRLRTSWVVGGWRPVEGASGRLGALLLGDPRPDGLGYRGRVGSGFSARGGALLLERLGTRATQTSPFRSKDDVEERGTRWVLPEVVVEVESLGITASGRLRQARYVGLRDDLTAEAVAEQQALEVDPLQEGERHG